MKEYVLDCLNNDEIVVNQLLDIDNKIQFTSCTINDLISLVNDIDINNYNDNNKYVFITDGELKTVLITLFNYYSSIKIININKKNVAIIKWFIMIIKKYYEGYGLESKILLDINNDYSKYDNENIVICGSKTYCSNMKLLFPNKLLKELIIE